MVSDGHGVSWKKIQLLSSFPWQKPVGIERLPWNARRAWLCCGSDRTGGEAGDVHPGLIAMPWCLEVLLTKGLDT